MEMAFLIGSSRLAKGGILILAGRNGKKRKNVALRIGHSSAHTLGLRPGRIGLVSAFV